jgi:hypothetical protein
MWDLWLTKWHWDRVFSEFFDFPVNIIPPWLSVLIDILGMNNRPAGGHFRDVVSPHQHERKQQQLSN